MKGVLVRRPLGVGDGLMDMVPHVGLELVLSGENALKAVQTTQSQI